MIRDLDSPRFAQTMAGVALATRTELDDTTMELYFKALEDIPMDLVEAGAVELVKGLKFWPMPAEWRAACDTILDRQARLNQMGQLRLTGNVSVDDFHCEACDDTGWAEIAFDCERLICRPTGTPPGTIHPHTGVTPCLNPDCVRRRGAEFQRGRRYAKKGA
jgi:hypothetical protein